MTPQDPAHASPDTAQWMARAARGDAEAWRCIVQAYTPRLYAVALRSCGDRDLAEEVTQAAFVKAVQAIRRYRDRGKFEAWLFRIALNHLRDEWRRRSRQRSAADVTLLTARPAGPASNPAQHTDRQEDLARIRRAVAAMAEPDRQVLHLRYTAALSFVQIAKALRRPLGTVLARHHRAIGKLRQQLKPDLGEA